YACSLRMNSLPYDQCGYPTGSPLDAYASSICSDVITSIWFGYVSRPNPAATSAMAPSYCASRSKSQSAPCEITPPTGPAPLMSPPPCETARGTPDTPRRAALHDASRNCAWPRRRVRTPPTATTPAPTPEATRARDT